MARRLSKVACAERRAGLEAGADGFGSGRIADAAQRFAPSKRYWAVVGNGPNLVAADGTETGLRVEMEVPVRCFELDGVGVAAEARTLLEKVDIMFFVEQPRRGEAGDSAADDGDLHEHPPRVERGRRVR